MAGESKVTTDHETIRQWAEARGGRPAAVEGTSGRGEEAGILRIEFPGYGGEEEDLKPIEWHEFFEKFDEKHLAFLYQEKKSGGEESRFCKFVDRDNA